MDIRAKVKDFIFKNLSIPEILKFGSVGIALTAYAIICYYILLDVLQLPLYPVYACVYFSGICMSYLINAQFTFKKKYNSKDSIKYFFTYVFGFLVGLLLLKSLSLVLPNLTDFTLVLLAIIPRVLITFIMVKFFIFK